MHYLVEVPPEQVAVLQDPAARPGTSAADSDKISRQLSLDRLERKQQENEDLLGQLPSPSPRTRPGRSGLRSSPSLERPSGTPNATDQASRPHDQAAARSPLGSAAGAERQSLSRASQAQVPRPHGNSSGGGQTLRDSQSHRTGTPDLQAVAAVFWLQRLATAAHRTLTTACRGALSSTASLACQRPAGLADSRALGDRGRRWLGQWRCAACTWCSRESFLDQERLRAESTIGAQERITHERAAHSCARAEHRGRER